MTAFLFGNIIFLTAWGLLFWFSPKTRSLQLFGSLLLVPFGFLDPIFRISYWHPPLLIKAIEPLSIETPIYCFAAGGLAAVVGNWFLKNKFSWENINWPKIGLFFLPAFVFYFIFYYLVKTNAMNALNFSFLTIWIVLVVKNIKSIRSFLPGIIVAIFTILAINLGSFAFPGFVKEYWNLENIWPLFLGTPTEEIFFAGVIAALWAILPKYITLRSN